MDNSATPPLIPALRFHWLTPFYDAVVCTTTRERTFKSALIDQADFSDGHKILDLGAGTGTLAIQIKERHPNSIVHAVDGDPRVLDLARRKAFGAGVEIDFHEGLSYSLPYEDAAFDRVVSTLFFHHLSWTDKVLTARELFRVMRPGSELHVADWGRPGNRLMRGLFVFVQLLDGFETTADNCAGRLVPLFQTAGFQDVESSTRIDTIFGTLRLYCARRPRRVRVCVTAATGAASLRVERCRTTIPAATATAAAPAA